MAGNPVFFGNAHTEDLKSELCPRPPEPEPVTVTVAGFHGSSQRSI